MPPIPFAMEVHPPRIHRLCLAVGFAASLHITASALDTRTWTSLDGRTFEATLVRDASQTVQLKGTEGRQLEIKKDQLSLGDLKYIIDATISRGPAAASVQSGNAYWGRIPIPAKEAKVDRKSWKESGASSLLPDKMLVLETPHFIIFYSEKVKPHACAENAERLWHEVNFFHPTFAPKWKDNRMALVLVDDSWTFERFGEWYASNLRAMGRVDAARLVQAEWSKKPYGELEFPQGVREKLKVFGDSKVFLAEKVPAPCGMQPAPMPSLPACSQSSWLRSPPTLAEGDWRS